MTKNLDPNQLARETIIFYEKEVEFYQIMEQIHWNFGMPYQWQDLEDTLHGDVEW